MTMKILMAGAGFAALAAAAPLSAQYGGYYGAPYGNAYGYHNNSAHVTQMAVNQCSAAVQNRLHNRTGAGIAGLIGSLMGAQTSGRVLAVTEVRPRGSTIRVRGVASSGRMAHSPYGVGYYGAVGAAHVPDLQFRCTVDYRGRIRDIDIDRR